MTARFRRQLLATTLLVSAGAIASPAWAQQDANQGPPVQPEQVQEPVLGDEPNQAIDDSATETQQGEIVVTGSRIARPNLTSNSPIQVSTGEEAVENADITLDTFLNTLPQVNPAGTTSSNNPGNNGQSNIDLRGLGANRNLVLIDGRRPMPSSSTQIVDINTIPQGLIERIEVVTGGAGAAYGADAVAGVVNFILKDDFEGLELSASYSNTLPETDAREYRLSGLIGANVADGRGNVAIAFDYANRQALIKAQRDFAAQATSTTPTPPTGRYLEGGNPFSQAALNALFASYGVPAAQAPGSALSQVHFNSDGTLFAGGAFNNARDVANFRYPLSTTGANPNLNYFPDFYSYNFDSINLLVLPLKRKSAFMRGNFEISEAFDIFTQAGYTEYSASTALAPTPVGVRIYNPANVPNQSFATSPLVSPGGASTFVTGFVIPLSNPFIPADLRPLLASRTGDIANLTGSGATEPINLAYRFLGTGLREQAFDNEVIQGLIGSRGRIADWLRYEIYHSRGRTTIDQEARGNVNVQQVQRLLEAADGGVSLCDGGFNPFGIQPISQDCVDFVDEVGRTSTKFSQKITQGFVQADLGELPGGTISAVVGAEKRDFRFSFDPGALFGPIAGFNTQLPIEGTNEFTDYFAELLLPILRDQPWAESLEVTLGYRSSKSDNADLVNGIDADSVTSDAYKVEVSYAPIDEVRFRGSYQRAVRAPNFGELFAGGGSFPQIFDPCSVGTFFRTSTGAAGRNLCINAGPQGIPAAAVDAFVALPGSQAPLGGAPNVNLQPEKADTFTVGAVFQAMGFTGSLDYYNIKVRDLIRIPDPNLFIAACHNYLGNLNPNLDPDNIYCAGINRNPNISALGAGPEIGGDENSNFIAINRGFLKTSGIDFQLGYRLPTEWAGERSALTANLLVSYLIDFKEQELPGVTIDYTGTAGYFGQGLSAGGGASHPEWKGTLNLAWNLNPITLSTRIRYIDSMRNRAELQYPGETDFSGPDEVFYFDAAVEANIENMTFRVGVNNVFDKLPPQYAPNVQSGTDPSLYDVIGRRFYVSGRLRY
jgi:outer membrane receptor protein involved in Fe transport